MKEHLTEEEVYDLAYGKLDVSNLKVDRLHELGSLLDLEYDEEKDAYKNPDFIVSDGLSVPFCSKCNPVQASRIYAPTISGTYSCICGNEYIVP